MKITDLTPIELSVIAAMRVGAKLTVNFNCETNSQARQCLVPFAAALNTKIVGFKKRGSWGTFRNSPATHVSAYATVRKCPDHVG